MDTWTPPAGSTLRALREEFGLTLRQVAGAELHHSFLSRLERGEVACSRRAFELYMAAINRARAGQAAAMAGLEAR